MAKDQIRESICTTVVRLLREERERRGFSMNVVAQRSGLSQSMISLVEHDLRNPTLDTLLRISEALNMDLHMILEKATKETRKQPTSWACQLTAR
jgi:transcriptional regulator with XRE-family HTH domain